MTFGIVIEAPIYLWIGAGIIILALIALAAARKK